MKCRQELDEIVITVFYDVEQTDVKKQTGDFGKVFVRSNEAAMIEEIATDVLKKLINFMPSSDTDRLVGMKAHLEKMRPFLLFDLDEAMIIGIWGLPGIGKSSIAIYLFCQLSVDFQLIVFIEANNTRPWSDDYNLKLSLLKHHVSKRKPKKKKDIENPDLQERLNNKKALVILDDVDLLIQLDAMVKETRWFGTASRIIVTTQDLRVLKAHGINHIYKVDFLSYYEAFQIFCMYAFGQSSPTDGFAELSWEVTYIPRR